MAGELSIMLGTPKKENWTRGSKQKGIWSTVASARVSTQSPRVPGTKMGCRLRRRPRERNQTPFAGRTDVVRMSMVGLNFPRN